MTSGTTLHPLVAELLDNLSDAGELELGESRLNDWRERLGARHDRHEVALHLVVVALRFRQHNAQAALRQMVALAAHVLGAEHTRTLLEKNGLPTQEAMAVVGHATGVASPLAGGLAPPTAGIKGRR